MGAEHRGGVLDGDVHGLCRHEAAMADYHLAITARAGVCVFRHRRTDVRQQSIAERNWWFVAGTDFCRDNGDRIVSGHPVSQYYHGPFPQRRAIPVAVDIPGTVRDYDRLRAGFYAFIQGIDENQPWFRHSFSGKLALTGTVRADTIARNVPRAKLT